MGQPAGSVETDLVVGSSKLYVFFGGIASNIGMPPFEFYRSSQILHHSRIFVRDLSQAWYQAGISEVSSDFASTARYLKERIDVSQVTKTVFVGNSMGGYAAILFGALLNVNRVVAFDPQTFIGPVRRRLYRDSRWRPQIRRALWHAKPRFRYLDVRPYVRRARGRTQFEIFASGGDRLDILHARRLTDLRRVTIHIVESPGHRVVRALRDHGRLAEIVRGANDHQ